MPEPLQSVLDAVRPSIRQLAPYIPGARPSVAGEKICRLASNENPLGASPQALAALGEFDNLARYPDNDGHALKQALAAHHDCPEECLILGNGSSDLLALVAHAWLEGGREAIFARHAFVVYPLLVQAAGADSCIAAAYPLDHGQPLGHDPQALLAQLSAHSHVLFIANPNNPTGTVLDDETLMALLDALPPQVLVVLDEAYAEYRQPIPPAARFLEYPQVIVTRTFSKIYGLAGLRIGYALAHPEIIGRLNRVRQPFNVNTPAQQAAVAALGDTPHIERSRESCAQGMTRLHAGATELGLPTLGQHGNFLTIGFGDRAADALDFLRQRNILVRALPEYELAEWLRITIGTAEEITVVMDALHDWNAS